MERREIESKVNQFLIEEMEIEADLIRDDALLKDDLDGVYAGIGVLYEGS